MIAAWNIIAGAAKYVRAMAAGDVATPEVQQRRASICAACPDTVRYRLPVVNVWYRTCGERGNPQENTNVCGCLVLYSEAEDSLNELRSARPAGKACVGSEHCPKGKW